MDKETLVNMQAPLKDQYKEDAEAAVVTLSAEGQVGEGVSCSVQTGKALVEAGLHPATGGPGTQACSGDMLLEALVACAGVTLQAVATNMEITIRSGTVKADGELDFRGTLGVSKEAPVGFKSINLTFDLDTDADEEQVAVLKKLTERYCVVKQTIENPVAVDTTIQT
ncbi:OsmC family protein [Alkalicoccus chagannorensis]|uniref:OsmC family protein n=1 Tax=Alkalicoccus chagannorensis TaxID=427072 RepID=UPI000424E416|nr:OsmC family protein [Alkalicoccus chagannorensis]